jgi:N6-L-threonylcarbamoyladenine synthase
MIILGIESSCDETGVALYDLDKGLLGHRLHSQIQMHERYGGVVPELASRDHIRRVIPLTEELLAATDIDRSQISAVAFTQGPGLSGALLVGAATATGIAHALNIPLIPIHHMEGHLLSPLLDAEKPSFPFISLLVSGGHTQLLQVDGIGKYTLLGDTVDDAAGEAFDKSAKLMGLSYPGGPAIAKLALEGEPGRYKLPRPKLHSGDLDFSFSGLKTAVLTTIKRDAVMPNDFPDLAAEVQAAIVDVLSAKCLKALEQTGFKTLVVAGGVSANLTLRERLLGGAKKLGARVFFPPLALCSDNGAMIAFAAALRVQDAMQKGLDWRTTVAQSALAGFDVKPRWPMSQL